MNLEVLLPAALAAGFFGSTHCLGMCGAIVVMLEESSGGSWLRRLLHNLGRLSCYALLGAIAAGAGRLVAAWPGQGLAALRVLAALLVVAMGVSLLFDRQPLQALERAGAKLWRYVAPLSRFVLPATSAPRAYAAGLLWGLLPCGLVYSAAALAATSADMAGGVLVMAAFWAGTVPALLFAAVSAERLARWRRAPRLRRATGVVLVALGVVALGLPHLHAGGAAPADAAPSAAAGHRH